MKKLAIWVVTAMFAVGTLSANAGLQDPNVKHEKQHKATHNKATQNKATRDVEKGADKTGREMERGADKAGKGIEHGAYDVTHNKATKKTDINKGNQKYGNQKYGSSKERKDKNQY